MKKCAPLLLLCSLIACGPGPSNPPDAGNPPDDGGVELQNDGGVDAGGGGGGGAGGGAGTDGGFSCSRHAATQTADIALLDEVRVDIQNATNATQRTNIVNAFVAAVADAGGTPLQQSDGGTRVAFFAVGNPQDATNGYSVAGEFNNWAAGQHKLTRVGQSDLFAAELNLSRDRGYAYKMVDGTTFYEDRRSQQVVWDGINRFNVGEFNALVYAERQDPTRGRLIAWRGWRSTSLNDNRDVFIYLPASYEQPPCAAHPSLYFHDGNESLTRSPFHMKADDHYKTAPSESAVLVFVALPTQNQRIAEYTFSVPFSRTSPPPRGDQYLLALKNELVPEISSKFRVCSTPKDRGLSGASLGGLISARGAFNHPDTWGYVGSQSGSYFWNSNELVTRAAADPVIPVRWYVDHGCPDDNCDSNRALVTNLKTKGYSVVHVEETNGQHDWSFWQKRLPQLLSTFRAGRGACGP